MSEIAQRLRAVGPHRRERAVDHRCLILAQLADDTDLLEALQQGVIEFAVGIDLALEEIVADPAAAQIEHLRAQLRDLGLQLALAPGGGTVAAGERAGDRPGLARDRGFHFGDLGRKREHIGIVGLEGFQPLAVIRLKPRALGPQRLQRGIGDLLARDPGPARLAIGLFGRDPLPRRLGERVVETQQRLARKRIAGRRARAVPLAATAAARAAAVELDDALPLRIGDQRPLGILEPLARDRELVLQKAAGVIGGVVTVLGGRGDKALGKTVGDARRAGRIGIGIGERHQITATLRGDLEIARELCGGGAGALGGRRCGIEEGGIFGQLQIARHPLGQRAAAQDAELGLEVLVIIAEARLRLVAAADDLRRLGVDLQGRLGTIFAGRQQRDDDREREREAERAEHQPAMPQHHLQCLINIDERRARGSLFRSGARRTGERQSAQPPLLLAGFAGFAGDSPPDLGHFRPAPLIAASRFACDGMAGMPPKVKWQNRLITR